MRHLFDLFPPKPEPMPQPTPMGEQPVLEVINTFDTGLPSGWCVAVLMPPPPHDAPWTELDADILIDATHQLFHAKGLEVADADEVYAYAQVGLLRGPVTLYLARLWIAGPEITRH